MSAIAHRLITAEEFVRLPNPSDGALDELDGGVIVTTPCPTFVHGLVTGNVGYHLRRHVHDRRLGRVTFRVGVRTRRDPDSVRGPDVTFWSADRLPLDEEAPGYPDVPPDLCVEVRSEHDRMSALRRKVREYLECGVKMVWIVDPADETVTVYRQPGEGRVLAEDSVITGDDVLPGFSCKVAEFFE